MTPLLFALVLTLPTPPESFDVASLFKAFRGATETASTLRQPPEAIRLYATDDAHTQICFIRGNAVYFYAKGRITRPLYAKVFSVPSINRITYHRGETGDAFLLWMDDEMVLSLGG